MPIGKVWQKLKAFKGIPTNMNPPLKESGRVITEPSAKANLLVEHFQTSSRENNHKVITNIHRIIEKQAKFCITF